MRDVAHELQCDEYDFNYRVSVKERLKNCWGFYDKICNKVKEYTGLTDMIASYISDCDDCYNDPNFKTLTMDICEYIQSSGTGTSPETENQPEIFIPEASSNDETSKDDNDENADDIQTESEEPIAGDSSADTHTPIENVVKRITGGYNAIFYGVPGCGKSYHIEHNILTDDSGKNTDKKYIERIVFYPDYTYSDFVGQITPTLKDNHVNYEFVPGPFTRILKKANNDPEHMYYLVIEEINRGNAAAIFGDIFQLLDRDKDGTSEYSITNVDINKNEQIEIPSNLTILATMNTSDQNVYTLDTAFQRRWEMHLIQNELDERDPLNNKEILDTGVLWKNFYKIINESIADLQSDQGLASTEDKRIGAHFVKEDDLKEADKFEKVISYLWNDAFKMNRPSLFDENFKEFEKVIQTFKGKSGFERFVIFNSSIIEKLKDASVVISKDEQAPASEESNGDN